MAECKEYLFNGCPHPQFCTDGCSGEALPSLAHNRDFPYAPAMTVPATDTMACCGDPADCGKRGMFCVMREPKHAGDNPGTPSQPSKIYMDMTLASRSHKEALLDRLRAQVPNMKASSVASQDQGFAQLAMDQQIEAAMPQSSVEAPTPVSDSAKRKATPIYSGVLRYFPDALAAVARLSKAGNDKHNKGGPLHWSRGKSDDHLDCVARHLIDAGEIDPETGEDHAAAMAWRALAFLQLVEEKRLSRV